MSIIATAVKHMMAAGITGEALLAAIADMEAQVRTEPKPRSSGAVRQERYRRNKASLVTESDACDVSPSPPPPLSPQTPQTPPPPHPYNNPARVRGSILERPADVSEQTWADFLAHRKRIKADATQTAVNRIRKQAEAAGWGMDDALAELVARGWRGFSSDWVENAAKPSAKPAAKPVDPLEQAERTAALYRRMGRDDDARELEAKAARLRTSTGPPRQIGQIVGGLIASG